jgi:NADPH2:quinone reductase
MAKAVKIERFGAPEVMVLYDGPVPTPGPGEALIRHNAIGLNYLDISQRQGHYPLALPTGLGVAGAGLVEAVGSTDGSIRVGDRVAYAGIQPGSYAEYRLAPIDRLVPLSADVDDMVVAATLQQGITAAFLLKEVYAVKPGDTVLFHAAAGGVGTIACQWAQSIGATVIGTVSNEQKAAHAYAHGCNFVIDYTSEDLVERVKDFTKGNGAQVVYDSVGQSVFEPSLSCLGFRGMLVSFGSASGEPSPLNVHKLAELGSLYLTRPRFIHYARARTDLLRYANLYFEQLSKGLRAPIGQRYRLAEVAKAHQEMEGRKTIGSSVLLPQDF